MTSCPLTIVSKSKRTNSERGKEFRAKRKQYETKLIHMVQELRNEIHDLQVLHSIRQQRIFQTRSNIQGPLVRLVQEYFSLFQCGMSMEPASNNTMVATQESFLRCSMCEDLDFGGIQAGVDALIDQWRRYASYHSKFRINVIRMEVEGTDENPIVTVTSDLHVKFSRQTFQYIFPHVAENTKLVNKYIGLEVTYRGVNRFQFTKEGRILVYDSNVGFVDALIKAGMNVMDVGILMQNALITDAFLLGEDPSSGNSPCCSPEYEIEQEEEEEEEEIATKRSRQLEIEYLLT